jgi:hypothetical protein
MARSARMARPEKYRLVFFAVGAEERSSQIIKHVFKNGNPIRKWNLISLECHPIRKGGPLLALSAAQIWFT